MNTSFHMRMRHITCECDMSHMNAHEWVQATSAEAHSTVCCSVLQCNAVSGSVLQCDAVCCSVLWLCHSTLWQSHISNEWVMSYINELRDKLMGHVKAHHCNTHQPTATHRSTLQHTATQRKMIQRHKREEATRHNGTNKVRRAVCCLWVPDGKEYFTSLPADWLQHAATHYNTLQHIATRCNIYILWQGVLRTHCNTLQPLSACCPAIK